MSNSDGVLPHSLEAEESLLGAALISPEAFAVAIRAVEPEDFYSTPHKAIYGGLVALWMRGERRADMVLLADELKSQNRLDEIGGPQKLIALVSDTAATANADRYAQIILERAVARRLHSAGLSIQDAAMDAARTGIDSALAGARAAIQGLDLPAGEASPSPNVDQFLDVEQEHDWLVDGLLERGDRMVITAKSGFGKSTFLRQMAMQFSAGIHPWENRLIPPIRTLVIDCENSINQVQRALRPLVAKARYELRGNPFDPDNFRIECKTDGLNLMERHDARWLMEKVATVKPDMVTIGPLYKLIGAENPNDEQPARHVAGVFDELRARYGVTLMIEAHSPHGKSLRPFGASLWLRWPEFGFGLRPQKVNPRRMKLEEWRGSRDERNWPELIEKDRGWPFEAVAQQQRAF